MMENSIKLIDGRQLAYAQSGDLGGMPLLFFHGSPGSRLFQPEEAKTLQNGIRLITVDRPGYGDSTFQVNRKIMDWPSDIKELVDHLQIQTFAVAGHSGGCPYVLSCAYLLPERVIHAVIISGAAPQNSFPRDEKISLINRLGFSFGRFIPWSLFGLIINLLYKKRSQNPLRDMQSHAGIRPPSDEELLSINEYQDICVRSEIEAFKPGLQGFARDAFLLTHSWGIPMNQVHVPVTIWHGTADDQAPVSMSKYLAASIPDHSLNLIPSEGHLLIFKHWDEILTDLTSKFR